MRTIKPLLGMIAVVACLVLPARGQQAQASGIPNDWSHHHLVFSKPSSAAVFQKLLQNPRYQMQQDWRSQQALSAAALDVKALQIVHSWGHPVTSNKTALKKDWSMNMQGTASTNVADVYPAKYSFSVTSQSCSDFVVFATGNSTTSSSQPSIVAFTNLYSGGGCGSTIPTVAWSYRTNAVASAAITTSPVLSLDGSQIVFAQGGYLVLIKVAPSGTLTAPTSLTLQPSASAYNTCTAPCMFRLPLQNTDTNSSPFYNYANDTLYVGDDGGYLHKFTPVFLGPPAEITTHWPVSGFSSEGGIGSPVFDSTSGNVFVSDINGGFFGDSGYLYRVSGSANPGTLVQSAQLDTDDIFDDAPIVDSSAEKVYYFSSDDGSRHGAVFQLATNFISGSSGSEATLGTSSSSVTEYAGTFDNIYFNSDSGTPPTSPTGNLYVCGKNSSGEANLYRVHIASNVIGSTGSAGPALTSASGIPCSPITEFDNGTDLIFLSVRNDSNTSTSVCGSGGGHGCLMSFNVNSGNTPTATASFLNQSGTAGTSGITIDNEVSSSTGGSQVYFAPLSNQSCAGNGTVGSGTGPCATQAGQNAL